MSIIAACEKGKEIGKIIRIRIDYRREFEKSSFSKYNSSERISHEFSAPITPWQNEVVERKNRTLQEMARLMLPAKSLPHYFWAEAINTTCHIHNPVTISPCTNVINYDLWKEMKPKIKYFRVFGSTCYILIYWEKIRKMDPKGDQGIFCQHQGILCV